MNNDRRTRLGEVRDTLDDIITQIEELKDEEQEAYDNMPEGQPNRTNDPPNLRIAHKKCGGNLSPHC